MTTHGWAGKGSTRAWRRVRAAVLARDHHRCRLNLNGCTGTATQVHHIAGKDAGDDPANLISACPTCNNQAGDPLKHNPGLKSVTRW